MNRRALLAICLAFAATAAPVARADRPFDASPYTLTPEDKARVAKATAYLQDLATVTGRFDQTDPSGSRSAGTLSMQRPGKARFAYDKPADMTIVSDGRTVALWDGRLKSYQKAPLSRTPLNLLLAQQIRLDRGVDIARVDTTAEGFAITAVDAHHQALGRIIIYFADRPVALKGWSIIDTQGRMTRVRLGPLAQRNGLDPALFVLNDPRKGA